MPANGIDPDLRALQEVRDAAQRAKAAAEAIRGFDQARTDALCAAMVRAGSDAALELAQLAVEETGIGQVHHKVLKNLFGTEGIWSSIREERTVGVLSKDERTGVIEVGTPVGVIAGIVPTTNPTSTALGKALIAVKGRNAIVLSPHPRARRCIARTAEILRRAIQSAGGPPDLVCALSNPTIESTGALMKHPKVALILATGGSGLVRAAYSSGKPAYGVGPGNVPVYVDRSADLSKVACALVASQSFDNGTLCCSEQALVLDRPIADALLGELQRRGAHLCCPGQTEKLASYANQGGIMNPELVGKDPWWVAEQAGFQVPRHTSILLARQEGVGRAHPLSIEILCPLLSVHEVDGWREGCATSMEVLHYGGLGHTCAVWAGEEDILEAWYMEKPASRIVINGPSSQGGVGYSTGLVPSMSLGCGPQAGNITSDNITARHLINVTRAARPRSDWSEIRRRDHARAGALCGVSAPRGSGLPGDPALGAAPAPRPAEDASSSLSNWRGNPPVVLSNSPNPGPAPPPPTPSAPSPPPSGSTALRSKVQPAPKASPPVFTRSADPRPPGPASRSAGASAPASRSTGASGPEVGAALSVQEIQSIMSQAGEGCPMGPCRGCPHSEVQTGACLA